jgi:uncharacterized protein (DUF1330 family)
MPKAYIAVEDIITDANKIEEYRIEVGPMIAKHDEPFDQGSLCRETRMKTYKIGLGMLATFGLGAGIVEGLHAQAPTPAYVVSEIEVTDPDAYAKEYVPLANKALADSGQKRLVSGGKTISLSGTPPATRIVLSMFESLEAAKAAYTSPAYLEARKIGERYGKLRIFAVEAIAQ